MSKPSEHFYEFGRFRVDAVSWLLLRDGAPVPLTLKAFDTLLALVENRGRLVEKDELLRRVWPDTAVEENNLTQQVSALRKVLGEDAEGRRYIETFPRRGYRFVAEVREVRGMPAAATPEAAAGAGEGPTAAGAKAETTEVAGGQTATAFGDVEAQAGDGARAGVKALAGRAAPLCLQDGLLLSQKRQPPPQKGRAATGGGEGSRQNLQTSHAQTGLPTAEPAAAPRPRARRRALPLSALFVTLAAAASAYLWASRGRMPLADAPARVRSIAVLPFQPLVPQGGDAYLELGMADALITRLSNIRQVTVRPTSAVMVYTAPGRDAAEIGRRLGVDAVLDGRLQKAGERVRVTVQLVRVGDGAPLWADTFDEEFTNIFGVQDSISQRVADALTLGLTREERRSLTKRYTENAEAYQLYMRGRYHWYRWTGEGWRKSREYFEQAIALDPNYALAYAGLSDSLSVLGFVAPPRENYAAAKRAALKSLELDETLCEGHLSLGALAMFQEWNRDAARAEFERALALNPNSAQAHDLYSILLASGGHTDEALAESRRALELDPLSPYMYTDLGATHYYARRYDAAEAEIMKALEIDADYADGLSYLGAIYEQQGRHAEAVAQWRRFMTLTGDAATADAVGRAHDASGYRGALREWLRLLKKRGSAHYVPPMTFADIHARLGEKEEALAWLEKAHEDRSFGLIWLKVEPRYEAFRGDPRFQGLLRKLNLAP